MNNLIYQEAEVEIVSYFTNLIKDALDPYAQEIDGSFKLTGLRERIILIFKNTLSLINGWGCTSQNYEDIASVCAHKMCEEVSDELFEIYRKHAERTFFLIDFRAFCSKVAEFLNTTFLKINKKNKILQKIST